MGHGRRVRQSRPPFALCCVGGGSNRRDCLLLCPRALLGSCPREHRQCGNADADRRPESLDKNFTTSHVCLLLWNPPLPSAAELRASGPFVGSGSDLGTRGIAAARVVRNHLRSDSWDFRGSRVPLYVTHQLPLQKETKTQSSRTLSASFCWLPSFKKPESEKRLA